MGSAGRLSCSRVKYGVMPFGPANGQRSIEVFLEPCGGDESWDREDSRNDPCYQEFMSKVKEKGLEGLYTKAIDGSQSVFLVFRGEHIETLDFAEDFTTFVRAITKDCIEFSKEVMKLKGTEMMLKGEIRPPFMVFYGKPRVFTATRDFYQNFNVVLIEMDMRKEEPYSQIALQEMLNHQNGQAMAFADHPSQLKKVPPQMDVIRKTSVIDTSEDGYVFDEALERNYRYFKFDEKAWDPDKVIV